MAGNTATNSASNWTFTLGYSDSDGENETNTRRNEALGDFDQTNSDLNIDGRHHHDSNSTYSKSDEQQISSIQKDGSDHALDEVSMHGSNTEKPSLNFESLFGFSSLDGGQQTLKHDKSPVRSDDEDNESPTAKKARKSLFGGASLEDGVDTDNEDTEMQCASAERPLSADRDLAENDLDGGQKTSRCAIRDRMSSLNLDLDDEFERAGPSNTFYNYASSHSEMESSDRGSPAPSRCSDDLPAEIRREMVQEPYELRKNIDRRTGGTWVDLDQSGNYDPEEEARQEQLKKAKAREKKKKAKQPKAPKVRIPKFIIRLKFKAIGTVLNIFDCEQNWPDNWSEEDSEDERERTQRRAFYRQNTPRIEPQVPIEDPKGEYDDLTGHPIARGCKNCREHEEDCSMVHGFTWPCEVCKEDRVECQPIIEPKVKGKCQRCANTREEDEDNYCSFEMLSLAPHDICDQCVDAEYMDCVAGPPSGYKTPRIDLDELSYGPNRKHIQCTNCRATKRRCSVKRRSDRGPCNHCKKSKIGCTFYDIPEVPKIPKKAKKKEAAREMEVGESSKAIADPVMTRSSFMLHLFTPEELAEMEAEEEIDESVVLEATPELEMEDAQGCRGVVTRINTSFAHPIRFLLTTQDTDDCNFCELPIFGIVGHNEKNVHVIRWNNGLGYSELQGGHREDFGQTTMCQSCTISRVQIVICPSHTIQPIAIENGMLDFDTAADDLMSAPLRSEQMASQQQRWCSMCFALASFKCCTGQPSLLSEGDMEVMFEGCGLRLCGSCEEKLRETFNGDLDTMATILELEPKMTEDQEDPEATPPRADVGFFKRNGLLMRNVEADTEGAGDTGGGIW